MRIACHTPFASLRGALLFTALASFAGAQNQTWIRQFGTSADDHAHAVGPDGAGGVYVSGRTVGSSVVPGEAWLARYDSAASQLWIRQFGSDGDEARSAAPDGLGGAYVSGSTYGSLGGPNAGGRDVYLAHYDGAGNQTWIRQLGTTSGEGADAAAPDGAGGVFVGGATSGSLGGPSAGAADAWLARYDNAGNQLWVRQLGTSSRDSATSAAPDGSGGVYVGGETQGILGGPTPNAGGFFDAWFARYDGAGNQLWIRQIGTSGHDGAYAAAPDDSGGVYVGGSAAGSLGGAGAGNGDAWLARYDGTGNQLWIRQLGTSGWDSAQSAAPDGSGGVYVSGYTNGSLGGASAGGTEAWLAHYDGTGNQLWIRQLGTSADDSAVGVAVNGSGGAYVGGSTDGSLGGTSAGGTDAWLALYDGFHVIRYCTPAIPNSSGQAGVLTATGSHTVVANDLTVTATQLPQASFGFFLTSRTQDLILGPGGSVGNLCLGGAIGRYVGSGQIKNSGATGSISLILDLTQTPTPTGLVQVLPGDTWNFTAWHRDAVIGVPTSNFADAVAVTFN